MLLFCLKSIFNTKVCDPQKKNILKSICQRCNNLKLTCIFNGPPNIYRTTQSATMGGPTDHPWFLPILHTDIVFILSMECCSCGPKSGHQKKFCLHNFKNTTFLKANYMFCKTLQTFTCLTGKFYLPWTVRQWDMWSPGSSSSPISHPLIQGTLVVTDRLHCPDGCRCWGPAFPGSHSTKGLWTHDSNWWKFS